MKSREFLKVAQTLLQDQGEGAWRSAVSRAYYAAFHTAREVMGILGFDVPRGERAHAYLWLRLSNCGDAQLRETGAALNILRQDRNIADYDLHRSLSQANAAKDVKKAEEVIRVLTTAAISEPARSVITVAMKTYERDVLKEITWKA
jgi:uncharacterized protein (UPF0332 family)